MSDTIAIVRRHQDVTEVFRLMKERLGLTNEFCDDVGGLTKGHTDKILGPTESKAWGRTTFDLFCEMFAIEFHVHVDLDAAKRMHDLWEKRRRPAAYSENNRISQKLIDKAKPLVLSHRAKEMNAARNCKLPSELRSKIARKAGKKRMRLVTKAQRSSMALKGWATRRRNKSIVETQSAATALQSPLADSPPPECPSTSAE